MTPLWNSSRLMEWAKGAHSGQGPSLARSAVPLVGSLGEIPGGPFVPRITGEGGPYGHPGLRSRLAQLYDASSEEVLIAQGASQANYLIAGALLEFGGTAIVETPVYEPVLRGIEMLADKVIRLPRRAEESFLPDVFELRRLLSKDVKLIWLTNLHNPTQREMDSQLVQDLAAACRNVGAQLVIDEVYLSFTREEFRTHGFTYGAISINSLDKAWGLDPLRVGWAVGPAEVIRRAYHLNNLMGVMQPFITEDLADQILRSDTALNWFRQRRQTSCGQMSLLTSFLRSVPSTELIPPSGGVNACLKLPGKADDLAFIAKLSAEKGVTAFPGSLFEMPGVIRVSIGCDPVQTRQHLGLLGEMIRESI